jgi:hypothetical protein
MITSTDAVKLIKKAVRARSSRVWSQANCSLTRSRVVFSSGIDLAEGEAVGFKVGTYGLH